MSPDQKGDKNRQVFRLMEDGWGILSYICRDWSLTRFLLHSHGYHISDCNSSLPVLLNSGLTTFQYVTPRFTILQGILIFPPPILFPKTQARFLSELISSLKKKKIRLFLLPQLDLYSFCLEDSSHCVLSHIIYLSSFISWHVFLFPCLIKPLLTWVSTAFRFSITP